MLEINRVSLLGFTSLIPSRLVINECFTPTNGNNLKWVFAHLIFSTEDWARALKGSTYCALNTLKD